MNCEGQGVVAVSGSRRGGGGSSAAAAGIDPTIMNVWGDFMSEEMETSTTATTTTTPAATSFTKTTATTTKSAASAASAAAAAAAAPSPSLSSGPRNYILPIPPRMRLIDGSSKKSSSSSKKSDANDGYYDVPTPGLLAQTGTLDASV